jgi:hypothetical protein
MEKFIGAELVTADVGWLQRAVQDPGFVELEAFQNFNRA